MSTYAERLADYIQSETLTHALYKHLAPLCRGDMSRTLRTMADDEARHLRAMQLEHYLLTGDSLPPGPAPRFDGSLAELLRMAYSGEWGAAEGYAREAQEQSDEKLKKLYLAQSRDELRHRAINRLMLGRLTGMGG